MARLQSHRSSVARPPEPTPGWNRVRSCTRNISCGPFSVDVPGPRRVRRVSARTRTGAGAVPTALALTRSRFLTKSNFAADVGATRTPRRSAQAAVAHGLVRATLRTAPEGGARSPGRCDEEIPRASSLRRASDETRRAVARRLERPDRVRRPGNFSAGIKHAIRPPPTANRPPRTQTADPRQPLVHRTVVAERDEQRDSPRGSAAHGAKPDRVRGQFLRRKSNVRSTPPPTAHREPPTRTADSDGCCNRYVHRTFVAERDERRDSPRGQSAPSPRTAYTKRPRRKSERVARDGGGSVASDALTRWRDAPETLVPLDAVFVLSAASGESRGGVPVTRYSPAALRVVAHRVGTRWGCARARDIVSPVSVLRRRWSCDAAVLRQPEVRGGS